MGVALVSFSAVTCKTMLPASQPDQSTSSIIPVEVLDMDLTHIHLMLNHVPVIAVGFGLLIGLFALVRKSREGTYTALWIFVLTGLVAVVVYLTGEPAEERVEDIAGVSKAIIEQHEEAAALALIGSVGLAAISLVGLYLLRRSSRLANWFVVTAVVGSLGVSGIMARTANLGGQVRHSEIRAAQTATDGAAKDAQATPGARGKDRHDDEDRDGK
jgi:uncharacterized membrane protein